MKAKRTHMIMKVLNANVDTIVCIGPHVCEDEDLHVYVFDESRHYDETQGGDTGIWCHILSLPYLG